MRTLTILTTLLTIATVAVAQDTPTTPNTLTLTDVQEMLDRYSETAMKTIEKHLLKKVHDYEQSLLEAQNESPAFEPDTSATYLLTFQIAGVSAPVCVLATEGPFSLDANSRSGNKDPNDSTEQEFSFQCEGELQRGAGDRILVTFKGSASHTTVKGQDNGRSIQEGAISFSGSAWYQIGDENQIARNDDIRVLLMVQRINSAAPAEAPAAR